MSTQCLDICLLFTGEYKGTPMQFTSAKEGCHRGVRRSGSRNDIRITRARYRFVQMSKGVWVGPTVGNEIEDRGDVGHEARGAWRSAGLTTPESAAREVRIDSECVVVTTTRVSCCEQMMVCRRQDWERTFVSSRLVSRSVQIH